MQMINTKVNSLLKGLSIGLSCLALTLFVFSSPLICTANSIHEKAVIEELFQDGSHILRGTIRESNSGEVIPFVSIYFEFNGEIMGTTSDLDGNYQLKIPEKVEGNIILKMSYVGMEKFEFELSTDDMAGIFQLNVAMEYAKDQIIGCEFPELREHTIQAGDNDRMIGLTYADD